METRRFVYRIAFLEQIKLSPVSCNDYASNSIRRFEGRRDVRINTVRIVIPSFFTPSLMTTVSFNTHKEGFRLRAVFKAEAASVPVHA